MGKAITAVWELLKKTLPIMAKWTIILLVLGAIIASVSYNAYTFVVARDTAILQQGASQGQMVMLQQINNAITSVKKVDLPVLGQDGKQTGTITLIQEK